MAERTPLVAANWKMHKTVAETEAFLDALLPRAAGWVPPSWSSARRTRPWPRPWRAAPEAASAWRRRTCTRSRRVRSPARSPPRC